MHDVMLFHEEETDENLDCKAFDQIQREALKVVHLNELVEIYTKQLKGDHEMLSKYKLVVFPDDILLIFRISLV